MNAGHFEKAFEEVIGHEGGYVNDSQDRGGETKFGISKRAYPHIDIANLELTEAKLIYMHDYFSTPRLALERISNESIAKEVFNTAVVMGVGTAGKTLQEALNLLNRDGRLFEDLKVDAWIGDSTMKAITLMQPRRLMKTLNGLQFCRFKEIVEKDPTQERFFAGWLERV